MGGFQDLRQHVLHANQLSTDFFGEACQWKNAAADETWLDITAKWELETKPLLVTVGSAPRPLSRAEEDGKDRARVLVSRVADWEGGSIVDRPRVGSLFKRAADVDSDDRPWTFTGEIAAFTDAFMTLVVERTRRPVDSRR